MQPTLLVTDGTSTSITCNYGIPDETYTFDSLKWRNYIQEQDSFIFLSSFDKGDPAPYLTSDAASRYRIAMDSTMNRSVLTITSVRFRSDNNKIYQCFVQVSKITDERLGKYSQGKTQLLVNGKYLHSMSPTATFL